MALWEFGVIELSAVSTSDLKLSAKALTYKWSLSISV